MKMSKKCVDFCHGSRTKAWTSSRTNHHECFFIPFFDIIFFSLFMTMTSQTKYSLVCFIKWISFGIISLQYNNERYRGELKYFIWKFDTSLSPAKIINVRREILKNILLNLWDTQFSEFGMKPLLTRYYELS